VKTNWHTHTYRCSHATGDFEDYIEEAIKHGYTALGFSEHGPLIDNEYHRLKRNQLREYLESFYQAKEKYQDRISLYAGLELEYVPEHDWYYDLLSNDTRIDYLVLGQHCAKVNGRQLYVPNAKEEHHVQYVDDLLVAMRTGYFDFLAHPDLWIKEKTAQAILLSERIINEAIALDLPLELNAHGLRKGVNYPRPFFWEMVAKAGAKVIINSDAHAVNALCDKHVLTLQSRAKELGLNVIHSPDLRKTR
jgi:histidinol-phosphatase (PHP family)